MKKTVRVNGYKKNIHNLEKLRIHKTSPADGTKDRPVHTLDRELLNPSLLVKIKAAMQNRGTVPQIL